MAAKIAARQRSTLLFRLTACLCVGFILYLLRDSWSTQRTGPHDQENRWTIPFTRPKTAAGIPTVEHQKDPHSSSAMLQSMMPSEDAPTPEPSPFRLEVSHADSCIEMPGAEHVMLLLKTGATVLYQKLPIHFLTTLRCINRRNFMIFSDLAQTFADHPVIDALANVGSEFRHHHPDFDLYRQLQEHHEQGKDVSELRGGNSWDLDKWKFLPMFHTAFEAAQPEIQWFVMIEADTSLSWTNLLLWLQTMNPQTPLYLGAQNFIGDTCFAHGGSGIILSRRALELLHQHRDAENATLYDHRWEQDTSAHCCGDEILARALLEINTPLTPAWPLIQGETPASLDWTRDHWCSPAITWHHVDAVQIDALWRFERAWVDSHGWNDGYRFRDVFLAFIDPLILHSNRSRWNNLSRDVQYVNTSVAFTNEHESQQQEQQQQQLRDFERAAVESQDACAAACAHPARAECLQWMFLPGRCYLGHAIRLGEAVEEGEEEAWVSGWVPERVEAFKERFRGCKVKWLSDGDGDIDDDGGGMAPYR